METGYAKLTVCFEAPFWICLYERSGGGSYEACKLTFGAEPGDQEVYAYLLEHWRQLPFSPPVAASSGSPAGEGEGGPGQPVPAAAGGGRGPKVCPPQGKAEGKAQRALNLENTKNAPPVLMRQGPTGVCSTGVFLRRWTADKLSALQGVLSIEGQMKHGGCGGRAAEGGGYSGLPIEKSR